MDFGHIDRTTTSGTTSLDRELRTLLVASAAPGDGKTTIARHLVAGAALPPNPGELVESHAMESLLEQAKSEYDLVVIDTPPLTAVSDAFPLLSKVDGVVIVGRVGRNRRDVAQRLHETLTGAGAPLLGVIANGFKSGGRGSYGYSYDYSYAPDKQPAPTPDAAPAGDVASTAAPSSNGAVTGERPVPTVDG